MTAPTEPATVLYTPPPERRPRPRLVAGTLVLASVLVGCMVGSLVLRLSAPNGGEVGTAPAAGQPITSAPVSGGGSNVRTEAGARAAAIRFLTAYGSPAMYDADRRGEIVGDITSPSLRGQLQGQVDEAFGLAAKNLGLDRRGTTPDGELVARTVPVGVRVLAYDRDQAVVEIWATGLLGIAGLASRNPVQETWSTETVALEWTPEGWRWAGLKHADGPAPIGSAQVPADADVIAQAARDFEAVSDGR